LFKLQPATTKYEKSIVFFWHSEPERARRCDVTYAGMELVLAKDVRSDAVFIDNDKQNHLTDREFDI
jgi:hypothetical protein